MTDITTPADLSTRPRTGGSWKKDGPLVGLEELSKLYRGPLNSAVDNWTSLLSGGERQRLALARYVFQ